MMEPAVRNVVLTTHIVSSAGWIGALAVFLAHALAAVFSVDALLVRAASLAMDLTAWFVILPLAIAALVTGVVQALATRWGLFRHYWVFFKLLLTVIATAVLLLKLGPIGHLAQQAAEPAFSGGTLPSLRMSLLVHAAGGLLILLAAATLAIYKPAGTMRGGGPRPTWVRIFRFILLALVLAVAAMLFMGGHGPGAHSP